jgi:DNA-binding MarR family transcriptional regulator
MRDYVDHILEQWLREAPDHDPSPMGVFGRISRASRLLERRIESVFARHHLQSGRFDVLAALRRAGEPYVLSPTSLYNSLLVTSGAMTHRLERLAADGLIERNRDPNDGRGLLVALTPAGMAALDDALADHLANEHVLIEALSPTERDQLAVLLRKLLVALDDTGEPEPAATGSAVDEATDEAH